MFSFWLKSRAPKHQAAPRMRCKPCLEALEDRCVLSSTPALLPIDHAATLPISAVAGQLFAGAVATFDSPDAAGLASSINWGDGHSGPGSILQTATQSYEVSGTNTYAQPGCYTVVVTIGANFDSPCMLQASATVAPKAGPTQFELSGSVAPGAVTLISGVAVPQGAFNTVVENTTPIVAAGGGHTTTSSLVVSSDLAQVPVGATERTNFTDQIPWASTAEQGLAQPVKDLALAASGEVLARSPLASSAIQAEAIAYVAAFLVPEETAVSSIPATATAAAASSLPAQADSAEPAESQALPTSAESFYRVPLYRVAERSELGGSAGAPSYQMTSAALLAANAAKQASQERARSDVRNEAKAAAEPAKRASAEAARGGVWSLTVSSLLEVATAWVGFHIVCSAASSRGCTSPPGVPENPEARGARLPRH